MPAKRTVDPANVLRRNQACHQCRRRKLKCDAKTPCGACVRSHRHSRAEGPITCTFDDDLAPQVTELRQENEELKAKLAEIEANMRSAGGSPSTLPHMPTPISEPDQLHSTGSAADDDPLQILLSMSAGTSRAQTSHATISPTLNAHLSPVSIELSTHSMSNDFPAIMDANSSSFDPLLELLYPAWPSRLPPPPLLHHLVETFFQACPHSARLLHRPSFLARLTFPPSSPQFPASGLLHAICAQAAFFSPHVGKPPIPDFSRRPANEVFQLATTRKLALRDSFGEEQARFAKEALDENAQIGERLYEMFQALVIMTWWYTSMARWAEVWTCTCLCLRYSIPLGLHLTNPAELLCPEPKEPFIEPPRTDIEAEERIQTFWLGYTSERLHTFFTPYAMSICDEDITQYLPCRQDDFENGLVIPFEPRQTLLTPKVLTTHPISMTDPFTLYIKGCVLMTKVKLFNLRWKSHTPGSANLDARDSAEFKELESLVTSFRMSFPLEYRSPIVNGRIDPTLFTVHMMPYACIISMHGAHADFMSPTCLSAPKVVLASRAILDLVHLLLSTSFDLSMLDHNCPSFWVQASRTLLSYLSSRILLQQKEEVATLLEEIKIFRTIFLGIADKTPTGYRQAKILDDTLEKTVKDSAGSLMEQQRAMNQALIAHHANIVSTAETLLMFNNPTPPHDYN